LSIFEIIHGNEREIMRIEMGLFINEKTGIEFDGFERGIEGVLGIEIEQKKLMGKGFERCEVAVIALDRLNSSLDDG
jgi:hypothetical protein